MLDVFVIHDSREHRDLIQQVLASVEESPGVPLYNVAVVKSSGQSGISAVGSAWTGRISLAIVRLMLTDMSGMDVIKQIRASCPTIEPIPVLEGNEGPDVWQALMEMGLTNVLKIHSTTAEITTVMASVYENLKPSLDRQPAPSDCYVVTVIGARQGIGKSVFASNLVCALAKNVNPKSKDTLLLLDFSLNPGDMGLFLDAPAASSIMDAVAQGGNLDIDYFSKILARHPRMGFNFLVSPAQEFDSSQMDYNMAGLIISVSRQAAKFVVIDTGQSQSGPTIAAVDYSDLIYLITTRDIAHLVATSNFIKFLKESRCVPLNRVKVIVNASDEGTDVLETEIEAMLDHPVAAYLPSAAARVVDSINNGIPMVEGHPNEPLSTVFEKLAERTYRRWD